MGRTIDGEGIKAKQGLNRQLETSGHGDPWDVCYL
jgi:hypothetical protein